MFRFSQGIGITSNPYNKETNNKNNAFGTKIMDNTYFLLQYKKENIIDKIGLQAGFMPLIFQTEDSKRQIAASIRLP